MEHSTTKYNNVRQKDLLEACLKGTCSRHIKGIASIEATQFDDNIYLLYVYLVNSVILRFYIDTKSDLKPFVSAINLQLRCDAMRSVPPMV